MVPHIALAQLLSLGLTVTGSASAELAHKGVSVPFFQSCITYTLVGATCWLGIYKAGWGQPQWKYMLLGGCDVFATCCIVRAFKYTSITSVSLLDAWSVPCVMLLTATLLQTRYTIRQVLACALAIGGLVLLLVLDSKETERRADSSNPALGDFLVLLGASGYAVSNVYTEHLLHHVSMTELLAGLGRYGALFALILSLASERAALKAADWSGSVAALFAGYSAVQCGIYVGIPVVIKLRGSTFFNLNMLTSDLYSAAARVLFFTSFTRHAAIAFGASCTLVFAGLIAYFTSPEPDAPGSAAPGILEVGQAAHPRPDSDDVERQRLLVGGSREQNVLLRRPSGAVSIPVGRAPGGPDEGFATSAGSVLSLEMEPHRRTG